MLQGEEELQEEAAVEVHRARDVAQQDQPHLAPLALPVAQLDDLAPRQVRPQRAPEVDPPAPPHRPAPPADPPGQPPGDLHGEPQDLVELLGAEGREVARGQRFLLGGRRHAERLAAILRFVLLAPALERQPLRRAPWLSIGASAMSPGMAGPASASASSSASTGSARSLEAAVEDRRLLRPGDEQGTQPEVDLLAIAEVEMIERRGRPRWPASGLIGSDWRRAAARRSGRRRTTAREPGTSREPEGTAPGRPSPPPRGSA